MLLSWQTPLHLSVLTERSDIVRRLLEAGASPNSTDRRGQTCFHMAVKNRSVECLATLIDSSKRLPDVNAMSYDGTQNRTLAVSDSSASSDVDGILISEGAVWPVWGLMSRKSASVKFRARCKKQNKNKRLSCRRDSARCG